jgi:serine phosphatase RsbU (regulator of sigma subunit)
LTATVTSDFREEYEVERNQWLRKRFLWYTAVLGSFHGLNMLATVFAWIFAAKLQITTPQLTALSALTVAVQTSLFIAAFVYAYKNVRSRERLLQLVSQLIVASGLIAIIVSPVLVHLVAITSGDALPSGVSSSTAIIGSIASVLTAHLAASLFIPWSPREAERPLVPLIAAYILMTLVFSEAPWLTKLMLIFGSPLVGVPGVLIAMWRTSRFRNRFQARVLRRSYGQMKRELVDARRIHEDLFPPPTTDGAVRLAYRYEPMGQIGGDFLYKHRFPGVEDGSNEPLSMAMIDVTGHGIAAALTVNRLFGELERLFGEDPDIAPGDVLSALNSYVHFTLATHSIYATAICVRIDPSLDTLEWASGGHPPAFVRGVDGRIDRLDSTSLVLGVTKGVDFESEQQSMPFGRGDTLIAYTDGAIEARNETGRMMGLNGLQKLVATLRPDAGDENGWASSLLHAVEQYRAGPPDDDTLIVEMYRPMTV